MARLLISQPKMMGNESGTLVNKPTQDAASLGLMLTLSMPFEMAWAETALSSDRLVLHSISLFDCK